MDKNIEDFLKSIEGINKQCPNVQNKAIAQYLIQQLQGLSIKRCNAIFNKALKLLEEQIVN